MDELSARVNERFNKYYRSMGDVSAGSVYELMRDAFLEGAKFGLDLAREISDAQVDALIAQHKEEPK